MHEVRLSEEFAREFSGLQAQAGKGNGEARLMLRLIDRGISKLVSNPEAGKHIPNRLVPCEYRLKYEVTNLWKLNLDAYWRLIYTLTGGKAELLAIVLDVLDHKEYDRKFGYHT